MEVLQRDRHQHPSNKSNRITSKLPPPSTTVGGSSSLRKSIIKISSSKPTAETTTTTSTTKTTTNDGMIDCCSPTINPTTDFKSTNDNMDKLNSFYTSSSVTGSSTRVIPVVYRSISQNDNECDEQQKQFGNSDFRSHHQTSSLSRTFNYKSPISGINLTISSPDTGSIYARSQQRRIQQQNRFIDRCQSPTIPFVGTSSGYGDSITNLFSTSSSNANSNSPIITSPPPDPNGSAFRLRTHHLQDIRRTSSTNRLYSDNQNHHLINNHENFSKTSNNNNNGNININNSSNNNENGKRYSINGDTTKEDVFKTLDQIEKRMLFFREISIELMDEKTKLLDALNKVSLFTKSNQQKTGQRTLTEVDLQDIRATTEHLSNRLNSIEIVIRPLHRSRSQIEAFKKANEYIDGLKRTLLNDGKILNAKQKCLSYISSCSSDDLEMDDNLLNFNRQSSKSCDSAATSPIPKMAPIDERFQKMVIECALEDQKAIKKNLKLLLEQIENLNK